LIRIPGGLRPSIAVLIVAALVVGACSSNPAATPTAVPTAAPTPTELVTGPGVAPTDSTAPVATPDSSPSGTDGPGSAPTGSPVAVSSAPTDGGPQESAPPNPTKAPKPLDAYVTRGPKGKHGEKRLALTFDADMYPFMYPTAQTTNKYDPRVIKLIEDNHLHATIFANGLYVKAFPDLIKELSQQPGIEIANHSWDHGAWPGCASRDPAAPPVTDKKAEITKAAKIIQDTVGYKPDWFRFGGFCYGSTSDLDLVKAQGEWPVGNSCFFGDSARWTAAQQIASVKGCPNGGIVVTHLNNSVYHPNIYEALKALIPWWKANGWTIVNVTELMGQGPPQN
jgi:peptidoglycan/xylan/chitin deacetylase (PgdA/CDA1 family)